MYVAQLRGHFLDLTKMENPLVSFLMRKGHYSRRGDITGLGESKTLQNTSILNKVPNNIQGFNSSFMK